MSKPFVLVTLFLSFVVFGHSQVRIRGSVRGVVADTACKAPMSGATVSVTPETDTAENAEFTAYTNSGWLVASDLTYTYTNNHTPGYNASIPLWSPSIARQLFAKKQGELRLTVFDILNQNTMMSKQVSLNQVSDSRTTTLTRYVMLTFTYNLNNFGQNRQRRGPGCCEGEVPQRRRRVWRGSQGFGGTGVSRCLIPIGTTRRW